MKKQIFGVIAIAIAIGASAFTPVKANHHKSALLYWYEVDYSTNPSGQIDNSMALKAHDEKENVDSPCDPGTDLDCLRGFSSQITSFPNTATGSDQIEKSADN